MTLKINQHAYPFVEQVKTLPVYLTGIGGTEYQGAVSRPEGYCWHQILYCGDGSGTLCYDSETVEITENCYVFIPAFYPHSYFPHSEKWDMRWVVFDGYACKDILNDLSLDRPVTVKAHGNVSMHKLYDKMFVALKTDKVYGNYTCAGLVYQYILDFHCLASDSSAKNKADKSDILMPALNYIEDNFRKDFSITELAEVSGVSQQYLCRLFNRTMNIRPSEYIIRRRLQEAKLLLSETDLPVRDVCIQSGFTDASYFSTVFKRYEGLSPAAYRQKNKGYI